MSSVGSGTQLLWTSSTISNRLLSQFRNAIANKNEQPYHLRPRHQPLGRPSCCRHLRRQTKRSNHPKLRSDVLKEVFVAYKFKSCSSKDFKLFYVPKSFSAILNLQRASVLFGRTNFETRNRKPCVTSSEPQRIQIAAASTQLEVTSAFLLIFLSGGFRLEWHCQLLWMT